MEDEPTKQEIGRRGLEAARQGNVKELKLLIDTYGLCYVEDWRRGLLLLVEAVAAKRREIVECLADVLARQVVLKEVQHCPSIETLTSIISRNITKMVEPLLKGPPAPRPGPDLFGFFIFPHMDCKSLLVRRPAWEEVLHIVLKHNNTNVYGNMRAFVILAMGKNPSENTKELIDALFECGCDINWADEEGPTALSKAIGGRDWNIVSSLLRYKAHNEEIAKCINFFVMTEIDKMFETFAEHRQKITVFRGDSDNSFFRAIREGNIPVLEDLLQRGDFVLNVEGTGEQAGGTQVKGILSPLHVAAFYRKKEVCEMLLRRGVNAFAEDGYGHTAADYVVMNDDLTMLAFFLTIKAVNSDTLFAAVRFNRPEIVKLLLQHGANVFSVDKQGRTLLHIAAAFNDNANCVKLLLEYGANPNAQDYSGATPFSSSCCCKAAPIIRVVDTFKVLLSYGADINIEPNLCSNTECSHHESRHLPLFYAQYCFETLNTLRCHHPEHKLVSTLLQHIIRLGAATLYISEEIVKFWLEGRYAGSFATMYTHEFVSACEEEVSEMKETKINNAISVFDILKASENQLAQLARNANLMETVFSEEYSDKFPSYHGLISGKFKIGKARRRLLDKSCESMQTMFPKLPVLCIENILRFLCNADLCMVSLATCDNLIK